MLPWWASLLFLLSGFLIGIIAGRSLGVSQATQQLIGLSMQKSMPGMPGMGGGFGSGAEYGQKGGTPRA